MLCGASDALLRVLWSYLKEPYDWEKTWTKEAHQRLLSSGLHR